MTKVNKEQLLNVQLGKLKQCPLCYLKDGQGALGEAICAMGVFDGVHSGHQQIIESMVAEAHAQQLPAVIITFDIDPDELFLARPDVKKLLTNEDRLAYLAALGADYILVATFDREFAAQTPEDFLNSLCSQGLIPRELHVGSDFRFGFHASGDINSITQWGAQRNCKAVPYDLYLHEGQPITATRIRSFLAEGRVNDATLMLTRPHYIKATVERGRGVGHGIGIPTANLTYETPYVPLSDGVYGGYLVVNNQVYRTAVSVGAPTTFGLTNRTIEAFLLDFDGDIYGQEVACYFVEYLRGMRKFDTVSELVETIKSNIAWVENNL